MKIAVTGGRGFVGTRIMPLLSQQHKVVFLNYEDGFNLINRDAVEKAIETSNSDYILHLAAYTNVDEAEKQKSQGKESIAWQTNVQGTMHVADVARKYNKKLIHISTDMVFGGIEQDWYHEKDSPSPVNFYGITKYEAEQKVLASEADAAILRIAYPYTWYSEKRDFVRLFLQFLKEKKAFSSVADAFFAPTYIDDIATMINLIIEKKLTGIIHGASGEKLSGYEIAQQLADKLGFDKSLVTPTTRDEFFRNRAPRSANTSLYNDTLQTLGIKLHTVTDALEEIPAELLTSVS